MLKSYWLSRSDDSRYPKQKVHVVLEGFSTKVKSKAEMQKFDNEINSKQNMITSSLLPRLILVEPKISECLQAVFR